MGTGNIAGVSIALNVGGPGAIFWMWVVAAVGMATALIEATLGQIFKVRSDDGAFRGGPAFYIQHGLRSRAGGIAFAGLPGVLDGDIWGIPERRQAGALPGSVRIGRAPISSSRVSRAPAA